MKKSERLAAFVQQLIPVTRGELDPCYLGWFTCFNTGQYYEAHDVLEHLWLQGTGNDHAFYQGLIQIAGAFVHLRKQFLRPDHPTDGRRLRPAVRLFHLGMGNIEPFGPVHHFLDVGKLLQLCRHYADAVVASEFTRNPWHPGHLPQVTLEGG